MVETSIAVIGAAIGTVFALFWILRPENKPADVQVVAQGSELGSVTMLFEGIHLQHASERATSLYHLIPDKEDWHSIRAKLRHRFPNLPLTPDSAPDGISTVHTQDQEDTAAIHLNRDGDFLRLSVSDNSAVLAGQTERLRDLEAELKNHKRASDTTPHATWQVNALGHVVWSNAAYSDLYEAIHGTDPKETNHVFQNSADFKPNEPKQRIQVQGSGHQDPDWFDINADFLDDVTIYHAVNVNAVVKSEIAKRNFVQTLAKTFAQLSIGLAIFDRNSQLALFNPALIDLTALPADFLSSRPTLISFFDRIRENRRMPEPKDYASWRQQITELIAAATDGRYQETWTLETGQTYRVNGRPHPDGAIAFLIEDITAEISVTRNFRAELELGQSLMDSFDDALAVFSSNGVLTFSNLSYREMWRLDPENSFADVTIADSIKDWDRLCISGTAWGDITDFVLDFGKKTSWEMPVSLAEGSALTCSVAKIATGATIVRFTRQSAHSRAIERAAISPTPN